MNEWINLLSAAVYTGDDANPSRWIWIMVAVGVILVIMAVLSVVASKKKAEEDDTDTTDEKKEN